MFLFHILIRGSIVIKNNTIGIGEVSRIAKRLSSGYTMAADYVTVSYVTISGEEVARNFAEKIVVNKLAACINIVKSVESVYEWDGKVEHENESLLIIKSHSSKAKELIEFIEKNHPYDCPEVISVKVEEGSKKYLDWIQESINKSTSNKEAR